MATNPITSDSLTVDFKSLMKIPVGDRMQAASISPDFLQSILNALTPIQIANAFPNYYKRQLPDVSNFITSYIQGRNGGNWNQTGGGDNGSASPYYDGETKHGGTRPAGVPEPTIAEMKKKLLEHGIDVDGTVNLVKNGAILAGDERLAALKSMSDDDLKAVGMLRTQDENGKTVIQMAPSQYEGMANDKIMEEYKKEFPPISFSPKERATLDFIAKREGAKDPNVIFGGERYKERLGLDKTPLTERSVAEVINEIMPKLREMSKADGYGVTNDGRVVGTSAVGTGQMIEGTLRANLLSLGIPEDQWGNIKFTKELQEKLTLENFKTSGIGDPNADPSTWNQGALGQQYESLNVGRGHAPMTQQEMSEIATKSSERPIAPGENITPEEAMRKLQEAETARYNEALTRRLYDQASPTSSEYIPDNSGRKFTVIKGNIDEVDPRLQDVISASSADLPPGYTVKAISGKDVRTTGTKNHPAGIAMDVQIYDPDGKLVPHNSNSAGWKYYEMLYRSAHIRGEEMYPDQKFIWGGAWISDAAGRGDPMHYQIVNPDVRGSSQSSGAYSFENGLDPSHPFAAEGGQLSPEERAAFDAGIKDKIKKEKEEAKKKQEEEERAAAAPPSTVNPPAPESAPTEQQAAAPTPSAETNVAAATPVPQFALGGNIYGPNEDITLVNNATGQPIAQVGQNEKIEKTGNAIQVTPETKLKADELTNKYDSSSDMEERMASVEDNIQNQQNQPVTNQMAQKARTPEKAQIETPHMWRESVAAAERPVSPSFNRAMARSKFFGEGHHFTRSAPGSQS